MSQATINLFTIGFTKKNAEQFFEKLREVGVARVVDVRLNNVSQLAGFSKRDDLRYFLKRIAGIDYVHMPQLAPTQAMLDDFKKNKSGWSLYESRFLELMGERAIESTVPHDLLDGGCLLCSEETPEQCHRRLVAEYLNRHWGNLSLTHIV